MTDSPPPASSSSKRLTAGTVLLTGIFIAAAATSNWAIESVGRDNGPLAPRTIPVGWGLDAPSGVLLIGFMIAVRDALHERVGLKGTMLVIVLGSLLSALLAPPALAVASGVTMLAAETTDALVYQELRRRGRMTAAFASNVVSSVVDSGLFLLIAYGAHAAADGTLALTVGKIQASLITLILLTAVTRASGPARAATRDASEEPATDTVSRARGPQN